jgi:hypothetical protein
VSDNPCGQNRLEIGFAVSFSCPGLMKCPRVRFLETEQTVFFLLKSLLAPKLLQSLERVFSWNSNLDIEEIGVQGEKH